MMDLTSSPRNDIALQYDDRLELGIKKEPTQSFAGCRFARIPRCDFLHLSGQLAGRKDFFLK